MRKLIRKYLKMKGSEVLHCNTIQRGEVASVSSSDSSGNPAELRLGRIVSRRPERFENGARPKRLSAFTLMEVLVVLAIMGILFMLVIPNQAGSIAMAKSIEAKSMLNQVHSLEKNHFFMYSKYTMDLDEIGFEQERLATDGGNANYKIQILEASNSSFVAQAEAVVDFDADGTMNVWQIDQNKNLKELTKD